MIEKLNRLKKCIARAKSGPAAVALKAAGLGEALTDIEGLVSELVADVIDHGNRLWMLEQVVDDLVVEQGKGVTS